MEAQVNRSYEFDSFRLVPAERQLLRDGQPVSLPPKAFDTLVVLVQNSGHALRKDELISQVWPDSFVEESNLNHNVSLIRKALNGNGAGGEAYVETVRGYGFRFNADVHTGSHEPVVVHRHTTTRVVFKEEHSETQKTTTIMQSPTWSARSVVALGILLVLTAGIATAYFGYFRPLQARSSTVVSSPAPAVIPNTSENPAAREYYLKGRYFWNKRTQDDILKARYEFANALNIDPNYARAYSGLADCMLMGAAAPGTMSAKELAEKAIALDDTVAEGHASLAYNLGAVEWNWPGAEAEFQKAISLDPNYATARHWHAYNLASLGRMDEAIAEMRKAESLEPLSLIIKTDVGHILYFARRYDEAILQYMKALEIDPNFRVAHWRLGEAYIQAHRYDEAISELQKAIDVDPAEKSTVEPWLAYAQAAAGQRQAALNILNRYKPEAELRRRAYFVALIYSGLGDTASALSWLEKAVAFHEGSVAPLKVEPMLDPLRNDPRFSELLRKMNLD